jgi:hypothetical protein
MKMIVVHFNPLEKYPPAVNLLRYLGTQKDNPIDIQVITTQTGRSSWIDEIEGVRRINIRWNQNQGKLSRLATYIIFNLKVLSRLIRTRPNVVLYYETLSSWAPVFYKRFVAKNVRLFIHYHEYSTVEEYKSGMLLNRWFHNKENKVYPFAEWISHTNNDRIELFKKDILHKTLSNIYTLSYYPPLLWWETSRLVEKRKDERIGFVYVGALSLDTMHTREMAEFVAANPAFCYWDIYSDNHSSEVIDFLKNLNTENINFKGTIVYDELPGVLPKYDIGLILYKGNTLNFAFNAPNKYFEYLACGINVLYGTGMKGMYSYEQPTVKPWTRGVDFESLEKSSLDEAKRIGDIPKPLYFAEKVYAPFSIKILNKSPS